jgi:hypothetical protein
MAARTRAALAALLHIGCGDMRPAHWRFVNHESAATIGLR